MVLNIRGYSLNEKVVNGKSYLTYYVNAEYPISAEKGIGYMGKCYAVPYDVMDKFINEYKLEKVSNIFGKNVEFYMNEQFKNQTFQIVGFIKLVK